MDVSIEKSKQSFFELRITISEKEIAEYVSNQTSTDVSIMGTYCVTCPNGMSHEISANGDIDAFFKGLAKCGGSFGMHIGRCLP